MHEGQKQDANECHGCCGGSSHERRQVVLQRVENGFFGCMNLKEDWCGLNSVAGSWLGFGEYWAY